MIYAANITTPANTAQTSLKKTVLTVTKGLVYKVEFYFPPGSAGLMGVAVLDGLYQVWPSTVGVFFKTDDETISFDDLFLKDAAPYTLQCYTYNEDTEHDHFLSVRIGMVSDEAFMARFIPNKSRQFFEKLRTKMMQERAAAAAAQQSTAEGILLQKLILEKGLT